MPGFHRHTSDRWRWYTIRQQRSLTLTATPVIDPMCSDELSILYRLNLERGLARIPLIEGYGAILIPGDLTENDRRSEPVIYQSLFSTEYLGFVAQIYSDRMRG